MQKAPEDALWSEDLLAFNFPWFIIHIIYSMTRFPHHGLLFVAVCLAASVLSSCQAPSASSERSGLFGGNKKWRGNLEQGENALAGGWGGSSNLASAKSSYSQVKITEPYVALTFDDGPHPRYTPRLLDILKQRNVKATFYVVGTNAKAYPHILKRMVQEGHEVANHTWSHPYLTKLSQSSVRKELDSTRDAIIQATGIPPVSYRPPYGAINSSLKSWIHSEYGYPTIMWSVDPLDWQKPGSGKVADRLVNGAHKGAILLAHDIHRGTIDAIPSTVDRLIQKGYRFVTVSQLIGLEQQQASLQPSAIPAPPAPTMAPAPGPAMVKPIPNPIPVSRDSAEQSESDASDGRASDNEEVDSEPEPVGTAAEADADSQ